MVACQTVSRIFIRVLSHTSCRVASELNMIIELFQTCSRRCLKTALLKSFFRHALLQALYQSLTILGKLQIKRAKLNSTETQEARESALLSSEHFFCLFVCHHMNHGHAILGRLSMFTPFQQCLHALGLGTASLEIKSGDIFTSTNPIKRPKLTMN